MHFENYSLASRLATKYHKNFHHNPKEEKLQTKDDVSEHEISSSGAYFRLWRYATSSDLALRVVAAFAAFGAGTAYPLMTIIFGNLINDFNDIAVGTKSSVDFRRSVNRNSLWFIYLFIGKLGLLYIANCLFCFTATRMTRQIRLEYLSKVLHKPLEFFDTKTPGSIASNLSTDINIIEVGLSDKLTTAFQAVGMIIGAFAIAFSKSWKMSLVVGTTIPYILVTTMFLGSMTTGFESQQRHQLTEASKVSEEAISSVSSVAALGAKNAIVANYSVPLVKAGKFGKKVGPLQAALFGNIFFTMQSGYALALFFGAKLISRREIKDTGTVILVLFCMLMGSSAMSLAAPVIPAFLKCIAASKQIFEILGRGGEEHDLYGEDLTTISQERISFQKVTFCYPSRPTITVLDNVSLEIEGGKSTAIVGHSGCGKSTIVALLERWYKPSEGTILVGKTDIERVKLSSLRKAIGLVQQDPMLFDDTIIENVLNGYHEADLVDLSDAEKYVLVANACKQANAHDFITTLPQGYSTIVGERGMSLSGGQKQRIAIARSIISNPRILVLDEATSALDSESERIVLSALEQASKGRTTLTIAHKLSTIEHVDRIVVMDHGCIVEEGTHANLIKAQGTYYKLLQTQSIARSKAEPMQKYGESLSSPEETLCIEPPHSVTYKLPLNLDSKSISRRINILQCITILLRDTQSVLPSILGGTLGACVAGAAIPMQAFLFSKLVTVFQLTGERLIRRADFWAAMFFALALTNLTSFVVFWFFFSRAGTTISTKYRKQYLRDLLSQEITFFEVIGNSSGALAALLSTDGDDIEMFFVTSLALLMVFTIDILACGLLSIIVGWRLGLVGVFGCFPLLFLAGYCRIRMDAGAQDRCAASFFESVRFGSEAVEAIKTVSSLSLEDRVVDRYEKRLQRAVEVSTKKTLVSMIFFSLSDCVDFLAIALVFWYGGQLVAKGQLSVDAFFIVYTAIIFGGQGAGFIFGYSSSITKAHAAINRVFYLHAQNPEDTPQPRSTEKKTNGPPSTSAITFSDVHFHYPTRPDVKVLDGISFSLRTGENLCIVGPSGSGKSTVMSLIERFYEPTSGRILNDSTDISTQNVASYRSHLGLVSQETHLYQGTVKENLILGSKEVAEKDLVQACKEANISDFIDSLPNGYNTDIGPRGMLLSGGQRQRIAIARMLLRNPTVLLLDEATSALDPESQNLVLEALDKAGKGRTTISVTHHLEVMRRADRILVLEKGKVIESGSYSELLSQSRRFRELVGELIRED